MAGIDLSKKRASHDDLGDGVYRTKDGNKITLDVDEMAKRAAQGNWTNLKMMLKLKAAAAR